MTQLLLLILLLILLNSILINSVYVITRTGMLFGFIDSWHERQVFYKSPKRKALFDYLWNPTFGCPPCMASIWTAALFPYYHHYFQTAWHLLPIIMVASVFVNKILHAIDENLKP